MFIANIEFSKVGWASPYPELSRKRPTADLVSRKVLTPLLGQILLCVLTQLVVFETVQLQPWLVHSGAVNVCLNLTSNAGSNLLA